MARFKKKTNERSQKINTASLPDIIFMLLFFFMVTTTMRETTLFVKNTPPVATEIQKLEPKSLVSFIYCGAPTSQYVGQFGDAPRIQLSDQIARLEDIPAYIESERARRREDERNMITFSLKVDRETQMGIVTDLKQEMRKANALKISYSTRVGEVGLRR
jgi:biopolymer transport protein ExbD